MHFLFIFPHSKAYNSQIVRTEPCGGTEKAVTYLGEAFAKLGHEVTTWTTLDEIRQARIPMPDVVITQEAQYLDKFPTAKRVWWVHHYSDQPIIQHHAGFARCFSDLNVCLSDTQCDELSKALKMQFNVIPYGLWFDEVQYSVKDPFRLIYASTPYRGLDQIPALFKKIRAEEPRATLAVCSSMATYNRGEQDMEYEALFAELRGIEGVELLGALCQQDLYAQYARASVFLYPNTWAETYCLALDEAIAHGCKPVTTALGALPERNGGSWTLVEMARPFGAPKGEPKKPASWLGVAERWLELI